MEDLSKSKRTQMNRIKLYFIFVLFFGQYALEAHTTQRSTIFLDLSERRVALEVYLAVNELRLAAPELNVALESLEQPHFQKSIITYMQKHLLVTGESSKDFPIHYQSISMDNTDLQPYLVISAYVDAPKAIKKFNIHCNAIIHRVVSHKIYLSVRGDFNKGVFEEKGKIIDIFNYQHFDSTFSRTSGGSSGFFVMFQHGMQHIAEGSDHLLFLFTLLLPIPLVASKRAWNMQRKPLKNSIKEILKMITAFTMGHTLTLALATFNLVSFSVQGVEILVAVSIFITALHAIRPLLRRFVFLTTAVFGMVHGLAFSETLTLFHFDPLTQGISLIGFTLGIETMQLILTLLVMPLLICITLVPRFFYYFRITGALFAMIAALSWISARIMEKTFFITNFFDNLPQQGIYIFALLLFMSMFSLNYFFYMQRTKIYK